MKDLRDRIKDSSIEDDNGCWIWQKSKKKFGYGYMTTGSRKDGTRKTDMSHRVSFAAFNGEIPDGMWVLHKCDTPSCVNPSHLYTGTRTDNVNDMMKRGRLNHSYGEECPNSILKNEDVLSIRNKRMVENTPYRKLAFEFGLKSHKTVMQICSGQLWPHLQLPEPPK